MRVTTLLAATVVALVAGVVTGSADMAFAQAGQPTDWGLGFQDSRSPVMDDLVWFDNFLLVLITAISLFVLGLLIFIMVRFNAKKNPEPSKTTHNTFIEVVWTVVPILILVVVAVPSFRLLYKQMEIPEAAMTIKVTGHSWRWEYEYPDHGGFFFDASMVEEKDLEPGQPRLLTTDYAVVVPVNKVVRVQVTADGVIHAWAMPSLGVKMDAVPGRLNETWFKATEVGTYYGQCSELCGLNHAFMPIMLKVVTEEEFDEWILWAQEEHAALPSDVQFAQVAQ
eukprot:s1_g1329.t1